MNITPADTRSRRAYQAAEPRQFGNLHERMKYLLAVAQRTHEYGQELITAIFDLETEVSFHEPQSPPFGRRAVTIGDLKVPMDTPSPNEQQESQAS